MPRPELWIFALVPESDVPQARSIVPEGVGSLEVIGGSSESFFQYCHYLWTHTALNHIEACPGKLELILSDTQFEICNKSRKNKRALARGLYCFVRIQAIFEAHGLNRPPSIPRKVRLLQPFSWSNVVFEICYFFDSNHFLPASNSCQPTVGCLMDRT